MSRTIRFWGRCAGVALIAVGARAAGLRGMPSTSVNRIDYLALRDVAAYHGLQVKAEGLRLHSPYHVFEFGADTRRAAYNGESVYLHEAPVELEEGQWAIAAADWRSLVDPMLRPRLYLPGDDPVLLVLDPGHGGNDEGATNRVGFVEKRLTLEVCRKVREQLAGEPIEVILTRDADYFSELEERARFVARRQADLLVSVHFNSSDNPAASGVETYVLPVAGHRSTSDNGGQPVTPDIFPGNTFDGSNMLLAQAIHRRMVRTLRAEDRGIRKARFVVLREAPCPAVLVECGFLSNPAEADKIRSTYYRDAIALSISAGILDLLDKRTRPPEALEPTEEPVPAAKADEPEEPPGPAPEPVPASPDPTPDPAARSSAPDSASRARATLRIHR